MAKKNKQIQESTIENYYDLKVDKIDELVAALKDDNAKFDNEVSMDIADCTGAETPDTVTKRGKRKQFDPYKTDFLGKIPAWLKAIFVKFWFAGAVCYFIIWGLQISDTLDLIVLTGAVLGIIVDILVNPLMRYMETDRREYNDYMMFPFPFKAFWTFFTNIVYYIIIVFGVSSVYSFINGICNLVNGTVSTPYLSVEPLLFGAFTVLLDMVLIGIKDLIVHLVKKSRNKEAEANV